MSKVNTTSDKVGYQHALHDLMHQEELSILSAVSSQQCMAWADQKENTGRTQVEGGPAGGKACQGYETPGKDRGTIPG